VETKARQDVVRRRRFTAEEYHRMGEAGILRRDERVELIYGEVVEMNPIGSRHAACVRELNWLLGRQLGDEFRVDVQNPVRLDQGLEPQPDLAVVRARDYRGSLPTPEDVLLLIEVADTSPAYDRSVKLPMYAEAGIREVWIVDLMGQSIERHTGVFGEGYRSTMRAGRSEGLQSEALPEVSLRTDDVLGPAEH
jgi:Uma2 family endonuclease